MKRNLDPRVKLYMLFVVSIIVMLSATTPLLWCIRTMITMVPIMLLIKEKRYAWALRFFVLYALAMILTFFVLGSGSTGMWKAFLTGYCGIILQFSPAFITAWYVIRTMKVDEFMSAMQKMHVPDSITISLAVVMRFFPTIKEEYGCIRDAMKMRGISLAGGNVWKMMEYRLIPLLFSCVSIGDELSAAAITRGLGGKVKRTSVVVLEMKSIDYLLMLFLTGAAAVFVFVKYWV